MTIHDEIAAMRAHLDKLEGKPGIRKTQREAFREQSQSEFRAAVLASGMKPAELARYIGISRQYMHDLIEGRREVQDWILRAMPPEAKLRDARGRIARVEDEAPISKVG